MRLSSNNYPSDSLNNHPEGEKQHSYVKIKFDAPIENTLSSEKGFMLKDDPVASDMKKMLYEGNPINDNSRVVGYMYWFDDSEDNDENEELVQQVLTDFCEEMQKKGVPIIHDDTMERIFVLLDVGSNDIEKLIEEDLIKYTTDKLKPKLAVEIVPPPMGKIDKK